MEKKLFYIVDNGESSITVRWQDLDDTLKYGFDDFDERTKKEDLPVFTVTPVFMTQEEYDKMPEYNG